MREKLYIKGMHGLGDNIHQRAILKQLRKRYEIWLETSWPQVYHDMPDVRLVNRGTILRTQLKNQHLHPQSFATDVPNHLRRLNISYTPALVRQKQSVLAAMMDNTRTDVGVADYSLPVLDEWKAKADVIIQQLKPSKPIMIYRPLMERTEWGGCPARNPDHAAYADLFDAIREKYYVISIGDFVPEVEWRVGRDIKADAEFHEGQLDLETIAGLTARAELVWASPGFAVVLARALETPVICIFGGYENSSSFSIGSGPYLGVDTIRPCQCFSHNHACEKKIDIPKATQQIGEFLHAIENREDQARAH